MKPLLTIFFFLFAASLVHGQTVDSLLSKTHAYDSTLLKPKAKVDSIQLSFHHKMDSLKAVYKKPLARIDSIETSFHQKTDSVKQAYQHKLNALESTSSALHNKIDSLGSLKLPATKYTHKLDSLNQEREKITAQADQKIQKLKAQTTDKLKSLDLPPELQNKVGAVTNNVDGFKLPGKDIDLPGVDNPLSKINGGNIPSLDKLPELGKLPEIGDDLKNINTGMGDVSKITSQAGGYQKDLQSISKGNLNEVKELPKTLENKAGSITGLDKVQGETKVLDQYKDQLAVVKNPEAMKEQAVQKVKQVAVDHFAGKQEVLQQAMDKMAKYKQKYASLQSLSEAGKRRPNEMRGKPLIERLLPGIGLQIQSRNNLWVDFNPYVGYRFTGRFNSGIGWNQRFAYDSKQNNFHARSRIYGPRAFSEFNLFKGFFPRLEVEAMNAFVPQSFMPYTTDLGKREWVYSAFFGLKKDYKFLKKVNGTSAIMFNLYNPRHKSPYVDVLNVRFGFEFPMKKKSKK